MKKNKVKHILTIFRKINNVPMRDVEDASGHRVHSISEYENNKRTPYKTTIVDIADCFKIKPDILLYSFGILPDEEMRIIKSDPFFYMEKIKELCNNHDNRYGEETIDLNQKNCYRALDYMKRGKLKSEVKSKN